jgi:hypothetical protein
MQDADIVEPPGKKARSEASLQDQEKDIEYDLGPGSLRSDLSYSGAKRRFREGARPEVVYAWRRHAEMRADDIAVRAKAEAKPPDPGRRRRRR